MKERPILFSAPMVRALLAGTKTQTRRTIKPQPDWDTPMPCPSETPEGWQGPLDYSLWSHEGDASDNPRRCPYGAPGDQLWVRETWRPTGAFDDMATREITAEFDNPKAAMREHLVYRADDKPFDGDYSGSWRPSIFMPRWASRITLEITGVSVERLNEITLPDCVAEGIPRGGPQHPDDIARTEYKELWESINGPGSWAANPLVWVVEFKRITP